MTMHDDDLITFAAQGAPALPSTERCGHVAHDGARIWYSMHGDGAPVVLLHGGLGHGGNWGYQVPALVAAGYQAVVIDSRGHGRSTRDARPLGYALMAGDVLAVMDALGIDRAALVGWSDGACTALTLAMRHPNRVTGVFFFACNMDPSGVKEVEFTPRLERCFDRHALDYAALSATPDDFEAFAAVVTQMQQTEPDCAPSDLLRIDVPVIVAHSEHEEFITREHAEYLARTIPGAGFLLLPGVSHFAPLQWPTMFSGAVLEFLSALS
jgi:pimeloyl-ACP methyl ester carboxylesterase